MRLLAEGGVRLSDLIREQIRQKSPYNFGGFMRNDRFFCPGDSDTIRVSSLIVIQRMAG